MQKLRFIENSLKILYFFHFLLTGCRHSLRQKRPENIIKIDLIKVGRAIKGKRQVKHTFSDTYQILLNKFDEIASVVLICEHTLA